MPLKLETGELGRVSAGWPKIEAARPPRDVEHGERVTISAAGADLSRDLGPAVTGHVFSYRAVRSRVTAMPEEEALAPSRPQHSDPSRPRHPHVAIDAYLRGMDLGAEQPRLADAAA